MRSRALPIPAMAVVWLAGSRVRRNELGAGVLVPGPQGDGSAPVIVWCANAT
jgi:hypothetical protein